MKNGCSVNSFLVSDLAKTVAFSAALYFKCTKDFWWSGVQALLGNLCCSQTLYSARGGEQQNSKTKGKAAQKGEAYFIGFNGTDPPALAAKTNRHRQSKQSAVDISKMTRFAAYIISTGITFAQLQNRKTLYHCLIYCVQKHIM